MQTLPIGQYDITKLSDEEIEAKLASTGWGGDHANALIQERQRRQMARLHSEVERLRHPHWTITPAFWVAVAAMVFAAIAAWPVIREWFLSSPSAAPTSHTLAATSSTTQTVQATTSPTTEQSAPADAEHDVKVYDYSSPEASFRSFQKAIRRKDAEALVIHAWQVSKHVPESPYKGITLQEAVAKFQSRQNFSFERIDISAIEGYLKLTEAKVVEEVSREHPYGQPEDWVCTLKVAWPDKGKQALLQVWNLKGEKEWWFWPDFGGYRIKISDVAGDQKH